MIKKYRNVNGGVLLEVLLMLSVMIVLFPIVHGKVKKRTDEIRNQMIVRDLLKVKNAVENYLKRKNVVEEKFGGSQISKTNVMMDIGINDLYDSGLERSFQEKNILGQNYKVRVKALHDDLGNIVYDAIIIATGDEDIPTMRIKDIVKESKGYAGYVDEKDKAIYGANWQLAVDAWCKKKTDNQDECEEGDIDKSSIVVKTGFSKKEYKYITKGPGNNAMNADLYLNMQNITNIGDLKVAGFVQLNDFELQSGARGNFTEVVVTDKLNVQEDSDSQEENQEEQDPTPENDSKKAEIVLNQLMHVGEALKFSVGLTQDKLNFSCNENRKKSRDGNVEDVLENGLPVFLKDVKLKQFLTVKGVLAFETEADCVYGSGSVECNQLKSAVAEKFDSSSENKNLSIANLLDFTDKNKDGDYDSDTKVLKIKELETRSFDGNKDVLFSELSSATEPGRFNVAKEECDIHLNDIVVSDVNAKLILGSNGGNVSGQSIKIGGIDITNKTPLSVIFRAILYEYADVHNLVYGDYPPTMSAGPRLPWYLISSVRCERNTNDDCGSSWYREEVIGE